MQERNHFFHLLLADFLNDLSQNTEKWSTDVNVGTIYGPTVENFIFYPFFEKSGSIGEGVLGLGPDDKNFKTFFWAAYECKI